MCKRPSGRMFPDAFVLTLSSTCPGEPPQTSPSKCILRRVKVAGTMLPLWPLRTLWTAAQIKRGSDVKNLTGMCPTVYAIQHFDWLTKCCWDSPPVLTIGDNEFLPLDQFDRLECFVHISNGQEAEVDHRISGNLLTILQPHKVPECSACLHSGKRRRWTFR